MVVVVTLCQTPLPLADTGIINLAAAAVNLRRRRWLHRLSATNESTAPSTQLTLLLVVQVRDSDLSPDRLNN